MDQPLTQVPPVPHDEPDDEGKVQIWCPFCDWRPPSRIAERRAKTFLSQHLSLRHDYRGTSGTAVNKQRQRERKGLARREKDPRYLGVFALTADQQAEAMALYKEDPKTWNLSALARRFGVSPATLKRVREIANESENLEDLIDISEVAALLALPTGSAYPHTRGADFPAPFKTGGYSNKKWWRRADVQDFITARAQRTCKLCGDPLAVTAEKWCRSCRCSKNAHKRRGGRAAPPETEVQAQVPAQTPPEAVQMPQDDPTADVAAFAHLLVEDISRQAVRIAELEQRAVGVEPLQDKLREAQRKASDLEDKLREEHRHSNALRATNERLMKERPSADVTKLEARIAELNAENDQLRQSEHAATVAAAKKDTALKGVIQGYLERERIPGARRGIPPNGARYRDGYASFGPDLNNPVIDRRTAEQLIRQAPESEKAGD